MQVNTINKLIFQKVTDWIESITDTELRKKIEKHAVITGGCITTMLQDIPVNDYDVYFSDINTLYQLAEYYGKEVMIRVLNGNNRESILIEHLHERLGMDKKQSIDYINSIEFEDDFAELTVRYKNLNPGQVKMDVAGDGYRVEFKEGEEKPKYAVAFVSPNAISLTDDIQIVLRFSGSVEEIHKTFDFIHATNYWTFKTGLVTNVKALESILTKELKYQGSLYPLTSIIRMKKFLKRGWNINAGEILKIMFQINELDLKNPEVLEEQLIGVDIAYFAKVIEILRGVPKDKINSIYLNTIINRVFSNFEDNLNTESE